MTRDDKPWLDLLRITRHHWDREGVYEFRRSEFKKALKCRTPALGAEVYSSLRERRVVYHTCKCRCCFSCGNRATRVWQKQQASALLDAPFVGIVLTQPKQFWGVFKANRELERDLPAIAAVALQYWAWKKHGVRIHLMAVLHTFGGFLNYCPHLHIMISAGGLDPAKKRWISSLMIDVEEITHFWRYALCLYLSEANSKGIIKGITSATSFQELVERQHRRGWNTHVSGNMPKEHFLAYGARYIRRMPIAQRRILKVTASEVVYLAKDTRRHCFVKERCSPIALLELLSQHLPGRYRHTMRFFGLSSPRAKNLTTRLVFALNDQTPRPRPKRQFWAQSIKESFGHDPLLDQFGERMRWTASLPSEP